MTERFNNGAIPTNITHPLPMTPDLGDHLDAQAVGPRLALAAMEPTTIASTHDADGFGTRPAYPNNRLTVRRTKPDRCTGAAVLRANRSSSATGYSG